MLTLIHLGHAGGHGQPRLRRLRRAAHGAERRVPVHHLRLRLVRRVLHQAPERVIRLWAASGAPMSQRQHGPRFNGLPALDAQGCAAQRPQLAARPGLRPLCQRKAAFAGLRPLALWALQWAARPRRLRRALSSSSSLRESSSAPLAGSRSIDRSMKICLSSS